MPQAEFEPPSVDDTSYEADALPTKPPRQEGFILLLNCKSLGSGWLSFRVVFNPRALTNFSTNCKKKKKKILHKFVNEPDLIRHD